MCPTSAELQDLLATVGAGFDAVNNEKASVGESFSTDQGEIASDAAAIRDQAARSRWYCDSGKIRDEFSRPADDLRIQRSLRCQQDLRHLVGVRWIQEMPALKSELLPDLGFDRRVADDRLFGGADRAVVETRRSKCPETALRRWRSVRQNGHIARPDAERRLP
ncbi:MAG: hypothetical protein IPJ30_13890 [Acidobacteria bacterium]|nr:hypothetical protein [Acidobacteriota bacterium]